MAVLVDFLILLVIAGVCGFLASQLMGAKRLNLIALVLLGFGGAIVGRFVAGLLGLPLLYQVYIGGHAFPIVWAFIGSVMVTAIFSYLFRH